MGIDGDNVLQKLKMKKFFAQYEYLDSELSETQYLFDIYNKDFLKECMGKNTREDASGASDSGASDNGEGVAVDEDANNVSVNAASDRVSVNAASDRASGSDEEDASGELDANDTSSSEIDESLKKLYKMLSLKTHPDKNGGDQKLFIEVKQAYHDKNIFKLIIIATKLNVDISYISDAVELFEKSISEMQLKIENFKKTIAWHWAHADDVKKEKIREYIKKN
jgi:hypothetical protein